MATRADHLVCQCKACGTTFRDPLDIYPGPTYCGGCYGMMRADAESRQCGRVAHFNPRNPEHVDIAQKAAEEAWLNCVGISAAISEALKDENIRPTEEAYFLALSHLRSWIAAA